MATRSLICAEFDNNEGIVSTYCHYDGCLQGVGASLLYNFNNEDAAFTLADMGYLSSLHDTLEENADPTSFGHRGHANHNKPTYYEDDAELVMNTEGVDFIYLWKDDQWWVASDDMVGVPSGIFLRLADVMPKH